MVLLPIPDQSGTIRTVLGAIDPSELGVTLPHEHIFIDFTLPLDEPERRRLAFRQLPKTASELEIWNLPLSSRRFSSSPSWGFPVVSRQRRSKLQRRMRRAK